MKKLKIAAVLAGAMAFPAFASDDMTKLITTLQAATQRVIERSMIDGAIQHLDLNTGEMTSLYPTENHPMVVALGDNYVLCADLSDGKGNSMPVDYYLTQNGNRFALVRTEINNRQPLKALMKAGKAHPVK
ncbi:MAG: hypothetical protein ACWA47_13565 [Brevirhabdus sp.]